MQDRKEPEATVDGAASVSVCRSFLGVAALAIFLAGCGNSSDRVVDLNGTWAGDSSIRHTITGESISASCNAVFSESGGNVHGSIDGAIIDSGTLEGDHLTFTCAPFVVDNHTVTSSGDATFSGDTITGTYEVRNSVLTNTSYWIVSFELTRL